MSTKPKLFERVVLALVLIATAFLTTPVQAARSVRSEWSYAADSILVRFRASASPGDKANAHALVGAERVQEYRLVPGLQHFRLKAGGMGVEAAVEHLSRLPFVAYAEPDYIVHPADTIPNDPRYGELWGMTNIRAPAAWDYFKGDPNFVVADLDTGMDYNHPDLAANVWTNPGEIPGNGTDDDNNGYIDDVHGWDFAYGDNAPLDGYSHGTHTAGTIGAAGNNGTGVVGVNWNVKIMPLKFFDDSGNGSTSNAILALQYAVAEGVKVSNNSWGGGPYEQSLYDAISAARDTGHIFVAAAGNGNIFGVGINNDSTPFYPASYNLDNIIAVAAINSNDTKAIFSNYGLTSVDLGAPGVNILSTVPGNAYATKQGTSMATPHVTGVVALLFAQNPAWSYAQVRNRILSTARPISALAGKTVTGGTLDAGAALAQAPAQPPSVPTNLTAAASSISQIDLSWSDSDTETGYKIERCTGVDCSNFTQIATVDANVTSYSNTGLTASTSYSYRVRAYNAVGDSGYSNQASATTQAAPTVPAAPSNLVATAISSSQINLSWMDNSGDETGFKVERCSGGDCLNFTQIATVGANVTSYSNTGLTASTGYSYQVRAYNTAGNSDYSNQASATTQAAPAVPAAPSMLVATAVSKSQIDLTWTDNANNETGFKIERCKGSTCTNFTQIATVGANVTKFSNTGLTANTAYRYRVRAYNAAGNSGYSNTATAKTLKR